MLFNIVLCRTAFSFFSYNAQHQQADDFGIWGAHAEGVICGKIGKYVE